MCLEGNGPKGIFFTSFMKIYLKVSNLLAFYIKNEKYIAKHKMQ